MTFWISWPHEISSISATFCAVLVKTVHVECRTCTHLSNKLVKEHLTELMAMRVPFPTVDLAEGVELLDSYVEHDKR